MSEKPRTRVISEPQVCMYLRMERDRVLYKQCKDEVSVQSVLICWRNCKHEYTQISCLFVLSDVRIAFLFMDMALGVFFSFPALENEQPPNAAIPTIKFKTVCFAWQTIVGMACCFMCEFSLIQWSDFVCIVTCSICHHRSWFDVTVVRIDSCNACTLCGLLFVRRWSSGQCDSLS